MQARKLHYINMPQLSFETSIPTRATRRNIPEDGILHTHRRESLKSYKNSRIRSWMMFCIIRNRHSFP
jgi:hypothetical protein